MIRFFRKIRQKLLSDSKIKKYLIYAVGEIILVVIGILIALHVNNLNEQKKLKEKELTYLKELKTTLEFDLENELKLCLIDIKKNMVAHEKFTKGLNVEDNLLNEDSLWSNMKGWIFPWKLEINFSPFRNLESVGIDLISCDSLRSQISKYYGYEVIYPLEFNREHQEFVRENHYRLLRENIYMEGTPWTKSQLIFLKNNLLARNLFNLDKVYYMERKKADLKYLIPVTEKLLNHIEKDITKLEQE